MSSTKIPDDNEHVVTSMTRLSNPHTTKEAAEETVEPNGGVLRLIRYFGHVIGLRRLASVFPKPQDNNLPNLGDFAAQLLHGLLQRGIHFQRSNKYTAPPEAIMHDRGAIVPSLVISPKSEWGVKQTLKLLKDCNIYGRLSVSVRSGGHGYFNGATCPGVMINLARMTQREISGNRLMLQPGCVLGQTIHTLANHHKAVPHGDCFGVGAGGHFLTAGWDLILARRFGLGCQSVIGGRVVLWDGSVVDVDEESHPSLLYAMRGGAAARVGVVTEIRLQLIEEPPLVTWRFTRINRGQLATCVANHAFEKAFTLPLDISVSFRFHFEPDHLDPICSFNIVSLLSKGETIQYLEQFLGEEVTSLVKDDSEWNEKALIDLRMLPASDFLSANPDMLGEISSTALYTKPLLYWKEASVLREMARSFQTSISHWVVPGCGSMMLDLYDAFHSARMNPLRERIYALVIQGGGRMIELQDHCSMPLGQALARFESHWERPGEEEWCRSFTDRISDILRSQEDKGPSRPYRGDIWLEEQASDPTLDSILGRYDRRFDSTG